MHDSQSLEAVLRSPEEGGVEIHADSAYRSGEQEIRLIKAGHVSQINEKWTRVHPLSDERKIINRTKSKIRSRVEHIFGAMTNEMGDICIRTIGRARAQVQIGLLNLTYNTKRVAFLIRKKHWNFDRVIAPVVS